MQSESAKIERGQEESSYLPAYVPPPPKVEKKVIKKVRFHEDDSFNASAEKPH